MTAGRSNREFYAALPAFDDFSRVGDPAVYRPVPDDWSLMVADIVRSTDAIAAGRYKDVNMVGAAVIAALLAVDQAAELPFVFAGDGATVAVPAELKEAASKALAGVRDMAQEAAGLVLRAAAIPVSHLRAGGVDVRLAKFELSPGNHLAMFAGGGLERAETILKDEVAARPFVLSPDMHSAADLDGLSCRWEPLPAQNGMIVSLVVRPLGIDAERVLPRVLSGLNAALGADLLAPHPDSAPVRRKALRFRFPPSGLALETRVLGWRKGRLKTLVRTVFHLLAFLFAYVTGRKIGPIEMERYLGELQQNTDYRKFDDTLRLVLDLTPERADAVAAYLAAEHAAGRLAYGLHQAPSALMTCLVFSLAASRHIHFIDGSNGGLSLAARALKAQLSTEAA